MKQFSKELGKVSVTPKGAWNINTTSERLDIVYDKRNNQAYIAKQNVPVGVDIDNREYWQPMNVTGYADNNFINLTTENENGTITAYESLEEAVATILPINRKVGATLSFYNLNSDRLDRQAEFELWQFNSTDLANWENKNYWNNIYYNWNVFAGWYVSVDSLENHVKIPNVGQYAYVGTNLNDALLYQCRTNGTWTNTGIKVRNYISVVVSGNITIGENGNWFSDGEDTGIPATPAVDEQLDNIIIQLQQHTTEISNLKKSDANLQDQITSNDSDITNLTAKHKSLSKTVQGIAATGGASTANNVTYNNDNSGLNAENTQDAIDEINNNTNNIYNIYEGFILTNNKSKITINKTFNKGDVIDINYKTFINTDDDTTYIDLSLLNLSESLLIINNIKSGVEKSYRYVFTKSVTNISFMVNQLPNRNDELSVQININKIDLSVDKILNSTANNRLVPYNYTGINITHNINNDCIVDLKHNLILLDKFNNLKSIEIPNVNIKIDDKTIIILYVDIIDKKIYFFDINNNNNKSNNFPNFKLVENIYNIVPIALIEKGVLKVEYLEKVISDIDNYNLNYTYDNSCYFVVGGSKNCLTKALFYNTSNISFKEDNNFINNVCLNIEDLNNRKSEFDARLEIPNEFINSNAGKKLFFFCEGFSNNITTVYFYINTTKITSVTFTNEYDTKIVYFEIPNTYKEGNYSSCILFSSPCKIGIVYIGTTYPNYIIPYLLNNNIICNKSVEDINNVLYTPLNIQEVNGDKALDNNKIIGRRRPVDLNNDLKLEYITIALADIANIGDKITIFVGVIDQRQWLITRSKYVGEIIKYQPTNNNVVTIKFNNAIIYSGESLYIQVPTWAYSVDNVDIDNPVSYLSNKDYLTTSIQTDVNFNLYKLFTRKLNNTSLLYVDNKNISILKDKILNVENEINNNNIYVDNTTNKSYKIIVNNGKIQLKDLDYKNILVFGNSFTKHGLADFWYGFRGMASSVPELDYISLLTRGLGEGAKITQLENNGFEVDYSIDFDFENKINIPNVNNFDAVIIQLGENSPYKEDMKKCWINFINYIKSKCPTADIVQIIGWSTGDKLNAILEACNETKIKALNLREETYTGQFTEGDYVTGETKDEFNIIYPNVKTHPSDVGMLLIANRILKYFNKNELNLFRNIYITQPNDGQLKVPYNKWVVGGLVSIKFIPNSEAITDINITINDGKIIPTKRTNQYGIYYTFFMPDEDVYIK